ncbi:MAG: hypothetical protein EBU31_04380 [Proteobacteria bacterium]|nr:hypothetical protein [Pseudomonadota bacterium]
MSLPPIPHFIPLFFRLRQLACLIDTIRLCGRRLRLAGIAHQVRELFGVFLLLGDRGDPALPRTDELRRAGEFRALLAQFKLLLGFV